MRVGIALIAIEGVVAGLLDPSAGATARETTRASVDSSGGESNGNVDFVSAPISGDGRIVAFRSWADNLVAGDTNGASDVFVHDRITGITERVSVDSSGAEANGANGAPSISADGQIIAFSSGASNLVAGDANNIWDIFVHDRSTGITERVSVDSSGAESNAESFDPVVSKNGQFVAFSSLAYNLVHGDRNQHSDVFVHDRSTGITTLVSVDSSGAQGNNDSGYDFISYMGAAISSDGQVVAFLSYADNLVVGDTNGIADIFVHDRSTGITERVSVDSSGKESQFGGRGGSLTGTAISADGDSVAFCSLASDLVANDMNGDWDVFIKDRSTGITERVSVDSAGVEANAQSALSAISADGKVVSFGSVADNLVPNDSNGAGDAFVHDRTTGITERVSVDSSGAQGADFSWCPTVSSDGQVVAFISLAKNLVAGDTNGYSDVFVHELDWTDASWTNYGSGFPGTNGVPSFIPQEDPVLGTTLTVDLSNSFGGYTTGLLFVGNQRGTIHSVWGGDLLLIPVVTQVLGLSPGGTSFTGSLSTDPSLFGVAIDLQAIELDPGATKGVSFTQGLELVLGR